MKKRILFHREDIDQVNEYLAERNARQRAAAMAGEHLSLFIFVAGILTDLYITPDIFPEYQGYPFFISFFLGVAVRGLSKIHNNYTKI